MGTKLLPFIKLLAASMKIFGDSFCRVTHSQAIYSYLKVLSFVIDRGIRLISMDAK